LKGLIGNRRDNMINLDNMTIDFLDKSPNGRIKCSIGNWDGIGYRIPREALKDCRTIDDLKKNSIYFLLGKSIEKKDKACKAIYIGRAAKREKNTSFLMRMKEHERDHLKEFWDEVIVFIGTKDDTLEDTKLKYLEHKFCSLAEEANNYVIIKGKKESKKSVPETPRNLMNTFIENVKLILNYWGVSAFEGENVFYIGKESNEKATMKRICKNYIDYIILKDSHIKNPSSLGYNNSRSKYKHLINKNGTLKEDISFTSLSTAAVFVLGSNISGKVAWKTASGKTLK